jgi:protein TonB
MQDAAEVSWHMKYPEDLLLNRVSGLVELRMTVDAKGRAHDCVVQASTWASRFGEQSCEHLQEIARFDPAPDAQGNPVSGYFHATALLAIYKW